MQTLAARGIGGFNAMITHYEQHAPLGRSCTAEELGATGVFLASDGGSGITSKVLYVDGGSDHGHANCARRAASDGRGSSAASGTPSAGCATPSAPSRISASTPCGALAAIALGFACQISLAEWIAIFLCCALVLGAELINTALEAICDALHPEIHPKIRLAKDAAAAAVLVCAAASAAAAAIIFLR
ncbi:MAG: diacylglycerol kinase [Verrucomicrobiales bacterium]